MKEFAIGQSANDDRPTGLGSNGSHFEFGQVGGRAESNIDNSTPWLAASDGNLQLMQQSLSTLNLSIDAVDENGYTLLQAAASYNNLHVLNWLLEESKLKGLHSIVNAVDKEGDSALHYAEGLSAAKFLIEQAQIDVHIKNLDGKTALDTKSSELEEMKRDEDYNEDDSDVVNLKDTIEYLSSLQLAAQ
jgi:Ankyrin repeats (3 copies)